MIGILFDLQPKIDIGRAWCNLWTFQCLRTNLVTYSIEDNIDMMGFEGM